MKKQETIPPLEVWVRQTVLQATKENKALVEFNHREAVTFTFELGHQIRTSFPQYKTRVSYPLPDDIMDVLCQGVIGELTRLTVRKYRLCGGKVMTLDVISHHKGNEVRYRFDEFHSPTGDENLSAFVQKYFTDMGIYMRMK